MDLDGTNTGISIIYVHMDIAKIEGCYTKRKLEVKGRIYVGELAR